MFRCMICKKKRELTNDEKLEMGKYIEDKHLKAVDYLNKISLDDGYTCGEEENKKKHKYEFDESFDKEVHVAAKELGDIGYAEAVAIKNVIEYDLKIKEMIAQKDEEDKKRAELHNIVVEKQEKLKELTGNSKFEIWR